MPDYFTLVEFRTMPDMSSTAKYSDAAVELAAAYVVAIIERETGTSFIPRTVTAEIHDGGTDAVVLHQPNVQSVTSATESGVTVTDNLRVQSGIVRRFAAGSYAPGTWASGVGNVAVTYQAGYSATPPADIKSAAMQATRMRLLETASTSSVAERQTSISNDMGTIQISIAGEGRPTGYPTVDEVIMGWKRKLDVFGFA